MSGRTLTPFEEAVQQGHAAADSFYLTHGDDADALVKAGALAYPPNPFPEPSHDEPWSKRTEAPFYGFNRGWNTYYPERWKEAERAGGAA